MPATKISEKDNGANVISEELLLKTAKEITVKFIEVGRITPATFDDHFPAIFRTLATTVARERS